MLHTGREDFFCELFVECLVGELMKLERIGYVKASAANAAAY